MRTIYKYEHRIRDDVEVWLPQGAEILHVGYQGLGVDDKAFCIWALVDTKAPEEKRFFYVRGTGHKMTGQEGQHIGTFMLAGGALVFHVFDDIRMIA